MEHVFVSREEKKMRRPLEPSEREDAAAPAPTKGRRKAIDEVEDLGILYAALNYAAPLLRAHAICVFAFGNSAPFRQLLGLCMVSVGVGAARPAIFKVGGHIAALSEQDDASSRFHQLRLVASQGLRCALLLLLFGAGVQVFDPRPFGLAVLDGGTAASGYSIGEQLSLGAGLCVVWSVVWTLVQRSAPREQLAMADGTHDLSSATEDELLRAMPLALRVTSLAFRMVTIGESRSPHTRASHHSQPLTTLYSTLPLTLSHP